MPELRPARVWPRVADCDMDTTERLGRRPGAGEAPAGQTRAAVLPSPSWGQCWPALTTCRRCPQEPCHRRGFELLPQAPRRPGRGPASCPSPLRAAWPHRGHREWEAGGVGEGCSSPPPQPQASEAGGGYGGGGQPGRGGTKRLCWEERPELGREAFVENAERQAGRGGAGGEWGLCARRPHPGLSGPARLHGGPACVPPPGSLPETLSSAGWAVWLGHEESPGTPEVGVQDCGGGARF